MGPPQSPQRAQEERSNTNQKLILSQRRKAKRDEIESQADWEKSEKKISSREARKEHEGKRMSNGEVRTGQSSDFPAIHYSLSAIHAPKVLTILHPGDLCGLARKSDSQVKDAKSQEKLGGNVSSHHEKAAIFKWVPEKLKCQQRIRRNKQNRTGKRPPCTLPVGH